MENITSIAPKKEEQKKEFFIKRAWKKISGFCKKYSEEIIDVLVTAWIFLVGICYGWILGIFNKDNNRDHYNAGKHDGCIQGYRTCVEDLKSSGYQVYGGYGEDCSRMVVTKIIEAPFSADENAVGPLVEEDK